MDKVEASLAPFPNASHYLPIGQFPSIQKINYDT